MRLILTKPGEAKRLREELGLKQSDLAERARIDPKTLRSIERGDRPVSAAAVRNVARELGITLNALIDTRMLDQAVHENDQRSVRLTVMPLEQLVHEIRQSAGVRWELKVRPQAEQLVLLRELEILVNRVKEQDSALSDGTLSSQLEAIAVHNDLLARIETLNKQGITLLVGSYLHWESDTQTYEGRGTVCYFSARTLLIALTPISLAVCEVLPNLGEVPPDQAPNDGCHYYCNGKPIPVRQHELDDLSQEIPF